MPGTTVGLFMSFFFAGRPIPTVTWFVNDRIVEGQIESIGHHVIVNRLEVARVRRQHLNSTYKCQASNTKLMMPAEKLVRLELLRKCCSFSFELIETKTWKLVTVLIFYSCHVCNLRLYEITC